MNDDTAILSALHGDEPRPEDDHNDLADEIAKAAPKQWWNRGTIVLTAVVLLVGGFVGGLQAQKHWGTSSSSTASGFPGGLTGRSGYGGGTGTGGYPGGGTGGFPGAGTGSGARTGTGTGAGATGGGTASAASSATTGTVKLVDGSTIYVQTPDGDVVTVNTNGKTSVSAATKSSLKSVKAGQSITVQGAAGTDGSVTATSVTTGAK